jgi:hypothetical protein
MDLPLRPWPNDPERLDIQEYTDPDNDPMIPHALVLKPGLVIHSIYNGCWFGRWREICSCTAPMLSTSWAR